jgi:hypothetical protein
MAHSTSCDQALTFSCQTRETGSGGCCISFLKIHHSVDQPKTHISLGRSTQNTYITRSINPKHIYHSVDQPKTHTSLGRSTQNTYITRSINPKHIYHSVDQPKTHTSLGRSTQNTYITRSINPKHIYHSVDQPKTHTSLGRSTQNTYITRSINPKHIHHSVDQPKTHTSLGRSTQNTYIDTLIDYTDFITFIMRKRIKINKNESMYNENRLLFKHFSSFVWCLSSPHVHSLPVERSFTLTLNPKPQTPNPKP